MRRELFTFYCSVNFYYLYHLRQNKRIKLIRFRNSVNTSTNYFDAITAKGLTMWPSVLWWCGLKSSNMPTFAIATALCFLLRTYILLRSQAKFLAKKLFCSFVCFVFWRVFIRISYSLPVERIGNEEWISPLSNNSWLNQGASSLFLLRLPSARFSPTFFFFSDIYYSLHYITPNIFYSIISNTWNWNIFNFWLLRILYPRTVGSGT